MLILWFLFSCVGTFLFLYKLIIDAIEFTCIDYDLLPESTQLYIPQKVEKYEDKYKSELDLMHKQIVVNSRDVSERFDLLLKQSICDITAKINRELLAYESELNNEIEYDIVEQRTHFINDKMEQMKMELWARILVKDDILELAESQLIQERLVNLKYSFVMEHTPVGNVVMYYNHAKEAFEYYSDNVVPYRYLDIVCRKYVIMNLCSSLYVDINDELKKFQNRVLEEERKCEERKCEERKCEERKCEERKCEERVVTKPNVFAKLKNYKTPIIQSVKTYVKARTNKYLYQGRMNNFNFTKTLEAKQETMSFAEYKKTIMYVAK